jgi:hypothetical protein
MKLSAQDLLAIIRQTADLLLIIREAAEVHPTADRSLNVELDEFAHKAEAALRYWHFVKSNELVASDQGKPS